MYAYFSYFQHQVSSEEEVSESVRSLRNNGKWLIMMLAGGHFAAAVFNKSVPRKLLNVAAAIFEYFVARNMLLCFCRKEIVCHKTFHRYVVRAKGGTVQSARDGQGNAPKSVGAFLRRHHEAALSDVSPSSLDIRPLSSNTVP